MSAIIAYSDRWSVAPGETIRFMVSSANAEPYDVQIVRLRQPNAGPGLPPSNRSVLQLLVTVVMRAALRQFRSVHWPFSIVSPWTLATGFR